MQPLYKACGITIATSDLHWAPGSIGVPISEKIKAEVGKSDTLEISGPNVAVGYMEGGELVALKDCKYVTGDIIETMDEKDPGIISVTGHTKTILRTTGGEPLAAIPVERQLCAIKGVRDAIVLGHGEKFFMALFVVERELNNMLADL